MSGNWQCIDYQGQIALTLGWWPNWSEPYTERTLYVSTATTAHYPELIGTRWDVIADNAGFWRWSPNGAPRRQILRQSDLRGVVECKPIRKRRKGRDYDWRWVLGRWQRYYT